MINSMCEHIFGGGYNKNLNVQITLRDVLTEYQENRKTQGQGPMFVMS